MSRSTSPVDRGPGQGRVPYADAGSVHRYAVWRAHSMKLPLVELRVLNAVMVLTVSYSKLSDTTYLAHIARWAYGVEEATDKQVKRTGEILKALADRGLIQRRPPGKGRPGAATPGPTYFVALTPPEKNTPDLGPEVPPDSGRKYPQSGAENTPRLGPPPSSTEKVTEESTEKGTSSSKSKAPPTKGQGQSQGQVPDDENVDGPEESSPTSEGSDDDPSMDGPEETPSSASQSEEAMDGGIESPHPMVGQPVNGQRAARPQREKHLADGVELAREHDDPRIAWICPNCDVRTTMVPDTGCPRCEGGRLTKRQVAAQEARKPPPKKKVNAKHYDETRCEWPLGRPGERCINTGKPFDPLHREDGQAPNLCDDHVAMLRDGTEESSTPVPTEVAGEAQPEALPF